MRRECPTRGGPDGTLALSRSGDGRRAFNGGRLPDPIHQKDFSAMIRFYFHPAPNPAKVALMLEETGLPYEVVPIDTRKGEQFTAAYRAINPNSKTPAIEDGAGVGRCRLFSGTMPGSRARISSGSLTRSVRGPRRCAPTRSRSASSSRRRTTRRRDATCFQHWPR